MANQQINNPLIIRFEVLHDLSDEERKAVEGLSSHEARFHADEDIVREGDCPADSSLLLEGFVYRYRITPDGKRQILSFHVPGDIFDAQSFLLNYMDHSVAALTACRVALIPHSRLEALTENHPRLARAIWKDSLVDSAIFREWIVNVGRRSAYQRVAHLICEMYARLKAVGLATEHGMEWPYTQTEIGDATGLSVVHINRTLQELRHDGLITLENPTLQIHSWQALQDAGQFDPRYLHLGSPPPANHHKGRSRQ